MRDDATGEWLDWADVERRAKVLQLSTAPVLFRGVAATSAELEKVTQKLAAEPSAFGGERERLVVRVARGFAGYEFADVSGKYVRAGHVQTDEHWMFQEVRVQRH